LPVSFGSLKSATTEFVSFDVVDMHYPYNAIFGKGLLNILEVALQSPSTPKAEAGTGSKVAIKPECETKRVPLDPRVPDKTVIVAPGLTLEEVTELLLFLDKKSDVFT
jgi:hypothetical protein